MKDIIIFLFLLVIRPSIEDDGDRPVIKTSNGDLILEPANEKSVYLRTRGSNSKIYVNEVDLTQALQGNLTRYTTPQLIGDTSNDAVATYITSPGGVLERLDRLENQPVVNGTNSYATLRRRVNIMSRQITSLIARLDNIENHNYCYDGPCKNGGTCQRLPNAYFCQCPKNWEGTNCDVDVNECRNFAGTDLGCQNGATCINHLGSYECLCTSGWFGIHCNRRAKDCSGGDKEMCGHGTCVPVTTGAGIMCICDQGWKKNGTDYTCTTDVNECEESTGAHCSMNPKVECINLPGSFKCGVCPQGYEGNGYTCSDIDECAINNGGCSKSPLVSCQNTIGSRICSACPPGYQGDGTQCTWRGSCNFNHGGCHPSARCIENIAISASFVQCTCPRGMLGDGVGLSGCYIPITNPNATTCMGNPCGSHGQCTQLDKGITCVCEERYTGARCDQVKDLCADNPCKNGGICRVDLFIAAGYRCECTALYSGDMCQNQARTCGGVLDAEEGNIMYPLPNTTNKYIHNSRCAWVIETVSNKVINVTFNKFNLEGSHECIYDFLQIHDGRSSASQLIGRFCGNELPKGGNIISSHNALYFWFRSDQSVTSEGFSLHWSTIDPVCGGEVDATVHGSISSPGSPGNYPPNRDCYWHLSTDLGKRIQLHFFRIGLEAHVNCSFDYLEIFDGEHSIDPLLKRYCNTSQPAPLQSAGPEMLVHFHSDAYNSGEGFQITYAPIEGVPGCGGLYTAERGEISSPSFNGQYMPDLLCDYKILVPLDTKISIKIINFQVERSHRCRFDHLSIYDGPSTDAKLVGHFCGPNSPPNFVSSSNTIFIQFKTDHTVGREGFKIVYEILCHNTITGDSGIIKSPNYPHNYPSNRICEYIISSRPGKAITLSFQHFDIEDNRYYDCQYDNLEIRDGPNINSTLMGRYCDENIPPVQTSTHNYMYLKFSSDFSISGTGFLANFTTIDVTCGGIYTTQTGLINFPEGSNARYSNEQQCTWILQAPPNQNILVTWNRFDVEDLTSSCYGDYLTMTEIGDGQTIEYGKFCGNKLPPAITTTSNVLKLVFVSDESITRGGFSLSFSFLDPKTSCGGHYLATHGYIYSPGWPAEYQRNKDCIWTITVPVGQQILLNITIFELEVSYRRAVCTEDYLEIRNGPVETSPLIGKYCGTEIPKRIPSMSNSMYIHFHSDSYIEEKGFKIEWDGTATGCGGTLNSVSGVITSPNYPQPYGDSAECFWRVITSVGSTISLTFTDIDLEHHRECLSDYVEIYDGHDVSAAVLGKFCGTNAALSQLVSKSNQIYIKFRSDASIGGKGFSLAYITNCNTIITGYSGVIESPNFPNDYPTNLNCLWTITVPKGNIINATFTHFDFPQRQYSYYYRPRISGNSGYSRFSSHFQTSPSYSSYRSTYDVCSSDYVQLKDGKDKDFRVKYCGTTMPTKYSSRDSTVNVKLVTGSYFTRSGFRLEWIVDGCGGIIRKSYGVIRPPIHRRGIDEPTECEWLIETPFGTGVQIYFFGINMRESLNCTVDAIEVYNGINNVAPILMKLCHRQDTAYQTTSTSNYMFVRYRSTSGYGALDFRAHFSSTRSQCGGRFIGRSGYLYSPNYPRNYENQLNCLWTIEVQTNHKVQLDITDMDLYSYSTGEASQCGDNIKIYEGSNIKNTNYSMLYCGVSSTRETFISKSNIIIVEFTTDAYGSAKGFKANFSVTCGAVIRSNGVGFLKNYPLVDIHSEKNCTWTILAEKPEQRISLTFTHMDLSKSIDVSWNKLCPADFLKVFDGNDDKAPLRGEYCGRKVPPTLVSKGSAITVQLGAYTGSVTGEFSAHYSVLDTACGGTLTSEEGTITSPNYPSTYPLSADCIWTLKTSPGNKVSLTFEFFKLQSSTKCNDDYVEIRENDGGGKLLGVFCGDELPVNTTVAAQLYVKFHSDALGTAPGFVAHYGFIHGQDITGLTSGEIASPLYPSVFKGAGDFSWRIEATALTYIAITLSQLEIDIRGRVCYNYLTIYDGYDETAPILKEMCGILTPEEKEIRTTSNMVFIKMSLDESNTRSLFHLRWLEVKKDDNIIAPSSYICGSNETIMVPHNKSVSITSPNYPKEYYDNLDCEWIFQTIPGRHLKIDFTDFHLEESEDCFMDYVKIFKGVDGTNDWKNITDKLCLPSVTRNALEATNLMKVILHTDPYIAKTGFIGTISSVCGGTLTESSGVIETIGASSNNYSFRTLTCEWIVKVKPRRTITLLFERFHVRSEDTNSCTNYVSLRNGDSKESPILGTNKYCGDSIPDTNTLETSGNTLFVSYSTRALHTTQGFRLHYEEKEIDCGSNSKLDLVQPWKVIHSLNYGEPPLPYSDCVWTVMGPPGEVLRLDFIDWFNLSPPTAGECEKEYVEVRDGGSESSALIGKYCDQQINTIKTTGNIIYVKYVTNLAQPNNGFKANITIDICGGTVRSTMGEITSPGYPRYPNLPIGTVCEWRIKGMQGHSLWINPLDISLPESESPCSIKLVVEDAMPTNESQIGHYCNNPQHLQPIRSFSNEVLIKLYIQKPTNGIDTSYYKGFRVSYNSTGGVCGGTITSPSGFIESPGYPQTTSARYCRWTIDVPNKTSRIRLEFTNLDFVSSGSLIALYDDRTFRVSIAHLPDVQWNTSQTVYRSSGSSMTIYMWARTRAPGFRAQFTSDEPAICGGTLNSETGILTSPEGYTNESYYCQWHIKPDNLNGLDTLTSIHSDKTIYLKVNMNTSESSRRTYCRNTPKLTLMPSKNEHLHRDICSNGGDELRLPWPSVRLTAYQSKHQSMNFNVEWKTNPCGGEIEIGDDNLDILNLPSTYNGSLDCSWHVKVKTGGVVKMKLEGLFSSSCSKEFIKVHQSMEKISPILAEYCQNNSTQTTDALTLNFRRFIVEYHSDDYSNATSIKLKIGIDNLNTCGGVLTGFERTLTTPNFPKMYKENQECTWEIATSLGNRVSLSFVERFHVEETTNCTKDFVAVFDWIGESFVKVAHLCGRNIPGIINSTSNRMKVIFRSDAGINADGFKARWEPICGGQFTATVNEKFIYSPNFPDVYSSNLDCSYEIAGPDNAVTVKFISFYVEGAYTNIGHCEFDNVTVVGTDGWETEDVYCGEELPHTRSYINGVKLRFRTDSSIQRRGFKIMYKLKTCGGDIKQHAVITSGDDGEYDNSLNCIWNITAPANKNVVIRFAYFDLENNPECGMDYVAVFNGTTVDEDHRLAQLCGSKNSSLPTITSQGPHMIVQFVSDFSVAYNGFKAEIYFSYGETVGCGGTLDLTNSLQKTLKSPLINAAYVYEKYLDCHWHIKTTLDKVIRIEFTKFNIAPCQNANQTALGYSNCACDSVRILDGANPTSPIIGAYCGYTIPPKITSSFNTLFLILSTDGETESSGFEAKLTVQESQCGSQHFIATGTTQRIQSPKYDEGYVPRGMNCIYNIKEVDDKRLHINIKDLDLAPASPDTNECMQDRLVISGFIAKRNMTLGSDLISDSGYLFSDYAAEVFTDLQTPQNLYTLCGRVKSMDFYSYDAISITLYTTAEDTKQTYKGFDIELTNENDCERNYTDPQGRIQSSLSMTSADCYTVIQAPINHTISLYFFHVQSYFETEEYVEVLDGNQHDSKQIARFGDTADTKAVFSSGRYLLIHRHGNDYYPIRYDMNYVTTDKGQGCGGYLNSFQGVLTSPLYPSPYRKVATCEFELETLPATSLTLRFKSFDLGHRATCDQVFVQLLDRAGKVYATYCSDDAPADYKSPDNYVKIVYTTTMNTGGSGWVAQFMGLKRAP